VKVVLNGGLYGYRRSPIGRGQVVSAVMEVSRHQSAGVRSPGKWAQLAQCCFVYREVIVVTWFVLTPEIHFVCVYLVQHIDIELCVCVCVLLDSVQGSSGFDDVWSCLHLLIAVFTLMFTLHT